MSTGWQELVVPLLGLLPPPEVGKQQAVMRLQRQLPQLLPSTLTMTAAPCIFIKEMK